MKKLFILLLLFTTYNYCLAVVSQTQGDWRWRNSDGSETAATWKANQNATIAVDSSNEVIRLRIEVFTHCTDCQRFLAENDFLQYTTDRFKLNSWKNIGNDLKNPFVLAGTDSYVQQDQSTTPQITGSDRTFVAGKIMVSDSVIKGLNLPPYNIRSEFEWVIRTTSNLLPNTTYYFRQYGTTFNVFDTSVKRYPQLFTGTVLSLELSVFSARSEGKKVKVEWATMSEQDNDRFEVQRSGDGRAWETIARVKGRGSTAHAAYTIYDNNPSTGINYYRLQQIDAGGKYSFSEIKSVTMVAITKAFVSVLPNPASAGISFKVENTTIEDIRVILTDANGRTVHQQTFRDIQPGLLNGLNLRQRLSAGIYILKVMGNGFSESRKVIVQ